MQVLKRAGYMTTGTSILCMLWVIRILYVTQYTGTPHILIFLPSERSVMVQDRCGHLKQEFNKHVVNRNR